MFKENIKKIVDNRYFDVIFVTVINMIFFIVCNILFSPKYEQVDDFIIMNLISKADGNYSLYGVQMHPIICGMIVFLYKTAININWYTVFLLIMQFISFTIIGTVFMKKNKNIGILLYIAFMFVFYSKMLSYIQYTTISILCITSGFILLMYAIDDTKNVKRFNFIISIIMILVGCMIRFSTIIIAMPFMFLYFVMKFLKDKNLKNIRIFIILILLIILIKISFNVFYNFNPIYKEFLSFHDVRTYLHDYNWMNYQENKDVFESDNWTKNDRDVFYGYCFGDEDFFNTETLETLRKNALDKPEETNFFKRVVDVISILSYDVKVDRMYRFVFLLSAILIICINFLIRTKKSKDALEEKENNMRLNIANFSFIAMIFLHGLFIFLNRPMFRVVISIYIIEIAISMYVLIEIFKFNTKPIIKFIVIILILFISIMELQQNIYYSTRYNKENYSVYKDVLEYTSSNKENAYLYTLSMKDRYLAYSVYEKVPDDIFLNVRPLGDWDTYTQNYYDFKQRYDIDNLIESLYKKDNVYLISGNVIWGEAYGQYINIVKKYIEEHYNINLKIDIIKEFEKDIKIYKLKESK